MRRLPLHLLAVALAVGVIALAGMAGRPHVAAQRSAAQLDEEHRAIFRELVEIDTSPSGDVSRATRAVERRLREAGYAAADLTVAGPSPTCQNLMATLRGRSATATPVLLMAHLDVVPARRADWTHDPFVLREEHGWFYGRGTYDNKAGASVLVANMARWKRDGFVPARDIVMVLTCDEETTAEQGIRWLLDHQPRLKTAEYALNSDAGGVTPTASGRAVVGVQAAEKVYVTYTLTARNPGGHSSAPRADNAIYALAAALQRLAAYTFPVASNAVTRGSFAQSAALETGQRAEDFRAVGRGEVSGPAIDRLVADAALAPQLRSTCVATMLSGGHAENALPQSASATVNCRLLPGSDPDAVTAQLREAIADPAIDVAVTAAAVPSPPSPLRDDVMRAVTRLSAELWPDSLVVPEMSNGATDGLFLRNAGVPVYGVAGLFMPPEDDHSHGLDERVAVKALFDARELWDRLVRSLTATA